MSSRYAIIENNIVKNIVICSKEEASQNNWILAENAHIGDTYENGEFIRDDRFHNWDSIRNLRNLLLESSDWITISSLEKGVNVPQEWIIYRQKLRDITVDFETPEDVVFPEYPNNN